MKLKNQFKKYSPTDEIIHMLISNYVINGNNYKFLPKNIECNNLITQIEFICLENQIINNLKRIFSRYEISITKILSFNYLKSLNGTENDDIFEIALKCLNGLNRNEVFLVKKDQKSSVFLRNFLIFLVNFCILR